MSATRFAEYLSSCFTLTHVCTLVCEVHTEVFTEVKRDRQQQAATVKERGE